MSDFRESALIFGKAVAGIEPFTGAAIKVWEDFQEKAEKYRRDCREEAMRELVDALQRRLQDLQGRLEPGHVTSREFADLFHASITLTERTRTREKLRAAAHLIANAFLQSGDPEKCPLGELVFFATCVDALPSDAFRVLSAACQLAEGRAGEASETMFVRVSPNGIVDRLKMDEHYVMGLLGELGQRNFLLVRVDSHVRVDPHRYSAIVETTPLGFRFSRFIIAEGGKDDRQFA